MYDDPIIVDAPTIPLAKLEQMVARSTKQKALCGGQSKRYNVARTRTALQLWAEMKSYFKDAGRSLCADS
jgi:hypothetical protein